VAAEDAICCEFDYLCSRERNEQPKYYTRCYIVSKYFFSPFSCQDIHLIATIDRNNQQILISADVGVDEKAYWWVEIYEAAVGH
jgi:hypothetical protein